MANMCFGFVEVFGKETNINAFMEDIELIIKGKKTPYSLASLNGSDVKPYKNLKTVADRNDAIEFTTDWEPVFDQLTSLTSQHNLDFIYWYEELSQGIFGAYQLKSGFLIDYVIDNTEDFYKDFDDEFDKAEAIDAIKRKMTKQEPLRVSVF